MMYLKEIITIGPDLDMLCGKSAYTLIPGKPYTNTGACPFSWQEDRMVFLRNEQSWWQDDF